MDKNDIRNKATHKVKNSHYFERYIRLLDLFSNKNKSLPEGFVFVKDYIEVTVLDVKTLTFSKTKRCEIDDNHIEIIARNDNRVKIIDNQGKGRYVPKEVKELYFS